MNDPKRKYLFSSDSKHEPTATPAVWVIANVIGKGYRGRSISNKTGQFLTQLLSYLSPLKFEFTDKKNFEEIHR
jgi:hypothetical protein